MENSSYLQGDNKRYPERWQAILACCLQQPIITVVILIIYGILGTDYESLFASKFGADMFGGILSQFFAVMFIPLMMLCITKKDSASTLRIKKRTDAKQTLLLIVMSLSIFFLAQTANGIFVTALSNAFGEPSEIADIAEAENGLQLIFCIAVTCLLPAIGEEVFFRGYVMRGYERISPAVAVIVSSISFSLMHGNAQQMCYAFVLGLVMGTVTLMSDSLLAGSVMHFTLNLLSTLISYPPVYEKYLFFAENFSAIYGFAVLVVLPAVFIASFAYFVVYTRKKNKKLYGKAFVSDMVRPQYLKKQGAVKNTAEALCWVFFVFINIVSAVSVWRGV